MGRFADNRSELLFMKISLYRIVLVMAVGGLWGMVCTGTARGQVYGNSSTSGFGNFSGYATLGTSTLGNFKKYSTSIESNYDTRHDNPLSYSFSHSGPLSDTGLLRGGTGRNSIRMLPHTVSPPMRLSGSYNMMDMQTRSSIPSFGNVQRSNFYRGNVFSGGISSLTPMKGAYEKFGVSAEELTGSAQTDRTSFRNGYFANRSRLSRDSLRSSTSRLEESPRLSQRETITSTPWQGRGSGVGMGRNGFRNSWPAGEQGLRSQGRLYRQSTMPTSRF